MNLLGMFAKYWEAGHVKTRLAAGIGEAQAAEIYRLFVATLVERFATTADARQLVYAPLERAAEMKSAAGMHWQVVAQSDGDLGQRIHSFFEQSLAGGAERVVLIGSDSPTLPVEFVDDAFEMLRDHDLVLGPSHDGGYYLVGASARTPPIFTGVDWSTSRVLQQTLARAAAARLRHKLLPKWYDVDTRDDLDHLIRSLDQSPTFQPLQAAIQSALHPEG